MSGLLVSMWYGNSPENTRGPWRLWRPKLVEPWPLDLTVIKLTYNHWFKNLLSVTTSRFVEDVSCLRMNPWPLDSTVINIELLIHKFIFIQNKPICRRSDRTDGQFHNLEDSFILRICMNIQADMLRNGICNFLKIYFSNYDCLLRSLFRLLTSFELLKELLRCSLINTTTV